MSHRVVHLDDLEALSGPDFGGPPTFTPSEWEERFLAAAKEPTEEK